MSNTAQTPPPQPLVINLTFGEQGLQIGTSQPLDPQSLARGLVAALQAVLNQPAQEAPKIIGVGGPEAQAIARSAVDVRNRALVARRGFKLV